MTEFPPYPDNFGNHGRSTQWLPDTVLDDTAVVLDLRKCSVRDLQGRGLWLAGAGMHLF